MGGTHKSGHAATVAEAGRKAELARDYYEDTKAKELKELDKKEVKLLDELRKSLKTTDSIPNRTSMLVERIRRGKEDDEEEDNGGKEGVLRTKTKGRDRDDDGEKEEKETMILRDEKTKTKTKTYVSKADRKRLKKRRREEQQKEQNSTTTKTTQGGGQSDDDSFLK